MDTTILEKITPHRSALLAISIVGLTVPNGIFLYFTITSPDIYRAALQNPIALVFMAEAFFLMLFAAFWIHRYRLKAPGWLGFILLSLVGSLAFSVPFALWCYSKPRD